MYARACAAKALGVELERAGRTGSAAARYIPWQPTRLRSRLSAVRALANAAQGRWQTLVTVCSACHNVIKRTNYDMQNRDENFRTKVNNYIEARRRPTTAERRSCTILEMLRDEIGFDAAEKEGRKSAQGPQDRRVLRLPAAASRQGHGL